jgi:hypothetical protein
MHIAARRGGSRMASRERGRRLGPVLVLCAACAHMLCLPPGCICGCPFTAFNAVALSAGSPVGARVGAWGLLSTRGACSLRVRAAAAGARTGVQLAAMQNGFFNSVTRIVQYQRLRRLRSVPPTSEAKETARNATAHTSKDTRMSAPTSNMVGDLEEMHTGLGGSKNKHNTLSFTHDDATDREQGLAPELLSNFQQIFAVSDAWIQRLRNALRDPHSRMVVFFVDLDNVPKFFKTFTLDMLLRIEQSLPCKTFVVCSSCQPNELKKIEEGGWNEEQTRRIHFTLANAHKDSADAVCTVAHAKLDSILIAFGRQQDVRTIICSEDKIFQQVDDLLRRGSALSAVASKVQVAGALSDFLNVQRRLRTLGAGASASPPTLRQPRKESDSSRHCQGKPSVRGEEEGAGSGGAWASLLGGGGGGGGTDALKASAPTGLQQTLSGRRTGWGSRQTRKKAAQQKRLNNNMVPLKNNIVPLEGIQAEEQLLPVDAVKQMISIYKQLDQQEAAEAPAPSHDSVAPRPRGRRKGGAERRGGPVGGSGSPFVFAKTMEVIDLFVKGLRGGGGAGK